MKITIEGAVRNPRYLWEPVAISKCVYKNDKPWVRLGREPSTMGGYLHQLTIKTSANTYVFGFKDKDKLLAALYNFSMRENEHSVEALAEAEGPSMRVDFKDKGESNAGAVLNKFKTAFGSDTPSVYTQGMADENELT